MTRNVAIRQDQPDRKRDLLGPSVGLRIRETRTRQGMTLAQLGGEDLSRSFLSLVESGRSRISLRALAIVAERLETPIGHFLADEDSAHALQLAIDYAEIELERGHPDSCLATLDSVVPQSTGGARAEWLRGRAFAKTGDRSRGEHGLRAALELSRAGSDAILTAEILHSLAGSLYAAGNYDEASALTSEGLAIIVEEAPESALAGRLNVGMGHILYVKDEVDRAISHYDRAQEIFGSVYDLGNVGAIYSAMSLARRKQGNLDSALQYSRQSVAAFRVRRDWKQVARELNNIAMRLMEKGDLEAAAERAQESIDRAQEVGAQDIEAHARGTLASVCLQQGNLVAAEEQARAAEAMAGSTPLAQIDAWMVLAQVAAAKNDLERADELYNRVLTGLVELGHTSRFAETALKYSRFLQEQGKLEQALALAIRAAEARSTVRAL